MKIRFISQNDNLQQVFDALEPHTKVVFEKGVYRQKAVLNVPYVELCGNGDVEIVFDDFARKPDPNGFENQLTTFRSFTLAITADNVTMRGISVANDRDEPTKFGQEVALYVNGNNFKAENCVFTSTQDTLFCGPLPDDLVVRYDGFLPTNLRYREGATFQKFSGCKICGTVDFIFGCANALFENCEIISTDDGRDIGYIAAPAHCLAENIGFVFDSCDIVSDTSATVYLARPWRDFGKATFLNCSYGSHIACDGFVNWQGTERQRTARFAEFCQTPQSRADWINSLTREQAEQFWQYARSKFDF